MLKLNKLNDSKYMKFYSCEGRVTQEITNFYDYLGDSNLETGRYHLKSGVSQIIQKS